MFIVVLEVFFVCVIVISSTVIVAVVAFENVSALAAKVKVAELDVALTAGVS